MSTQDTDELNTIGSRCLTNMSVLSLVACALGAATLLWVSILVVL